MNKEKLASDVMFKDYPDIVSVADLQKMLGIKRTKAYELLKNQEIKATKIGSNYKIPKFNIISYIIGEEQVWTDIYKPEMESIM